MAFLNKKRIRVKSDLVTIIFLHRSSFLSNNYDDENKVPGFDCRLGVVASTLYLEQNFHHDVVIYLSICSYSTQIIQKLTSLRASSPIWASETSLARTREQAAKPLARSFSGS